MSSIESIVTVSETPNRLQNLHDVQHLWDSVFRTNQLFINRELLRSTYIPEILPHREQEITELASILSPALNYEAPSNILMFGKPGIGKTAVSKLVGGEIQLRGKEVGKQIHFIYINCQLSDTLYKILQHISKQLSNNETDSIPVSGLPIDVLFDKIVSLPDKQKQMLIITLDEVDKIRDDITLYTLTRINEQLQLARLSVICISNNLRFTDFLDGRVKSSLSQETMVFNPYNAEQLQDILRIRCQQALVPNVLADDVIPLCAAFAAQEHGDARRALDLLRVSVELAERKRECKVTSKHVRLAQNKIEKDRIEEVIHNLPAQQRLLLHAIHLLQKFNQHMGKQSQMMTGELYNQYVELSKIVHYTPLSQRRVTDFISELDTLGIITAREISKGRNGRTREIQLAIPATELARILHDDEFIDDLRQVKMKNQMKLL
jgi:cell division control protein 6